MEDCLGSISFDRSLTMLLILLSESFLKLSFEVELMDNDDPSIDDINKMGNLPTYITKDIRKQPVKPLKILSTL